jgi:WD40 repeat protein
MRFECHGDIRAWDTESGRVRQTFQHEPPRRILFMSLTSDGTKFATCEYLPGVYERFSDEVVSIWDVATGKYETLPKGVERFSAFSPDGHTLATSAQDKDNYTQAVKLFEPGSGREKLSIPIRDKYTWAHVEAFSPDGSVMVGDYQVFARPKTRDDSKYWLKWWDAANGRELASIDGQFGTCRFSPDGKTLATTKWNGESCSLCLFRVADQKLLCTIELEKKAKGERLVAGQRAFSPDSRWLALVTQRFPGSGGGNDNDERDVPQAHIHLIDVAAGDKRETLVPPQGLVHALAFSPDGKTLATGGYGRVQLWNMTAPPGGL